MKKIRYGENMHKILIKIDARIWAIEHCSDVIFKTTFFVSGGTSCSLKIDIDFSNAPHKFIFTTHEKIKNTYNFIIKTAKQVLKVYFQFF